ncbi:DUF1156 domain-containing protein [Kocuria sp. CPCC 205231]|uniref:DUF1156 domain-containing protein n=1 Tax=Kocuria sp. CPCC 205231 TaxID=3073551 RepID=UPI0034D56CEA
MTDIPVLDLDFDNADLGEPTLTRDASGSHKRKLIEVSLPLEDINKASGREKSIRHGHPSTLHLWWSRKPLATARAVLFAQLVDDPSAHPDRFPTDEAQRIERERLHNIIRELVVWENSNDPKVLDRVREEIWKSTGGNPPPVLDPFAGGGTIPLEAQRLGLEAHASDLNPVAALINKALIEIPPRFRDQPPIFPDAEDSRTVVWTGAKGLAEDVRRYGQWIRDEAERRIGHLYPKATLDKGSQADVIAWIWARTVTCPNPACGIEMPLTSKWWLGKKKGKEAYLVPHVVNDPSAQGGRRVRFEIGHDPTEAPKNDDGTMRGRGKAVCIACESAVPAEHIKAEGKAGRMRSMLMATAVTGQRRRIYLAPTDIHVKSANVNRPDSVPQGSLSYDPRALWTPAYGLTEFADLFTPRQLTLLTTFCDLVGEVRDRILIDSRTGGRVEGEPYSSGGSDAAAYADAVCTYLAMVVSRITDYQSSITTWASNPQMEILRNLFSRQAIPLAWDYAEGNPFAASSGSWGKMLEAVSEAIEHTPAGIQAQVSAADAVSCDYSNMVISTDPPYYDSIGYSGLSDFFYVWLRRTLRTIHPDLFSTMLVPKAEELVANPYRHNGREGAEKFFEIGFERVFNKVREDGGAKEYPVTVYYAFKQQELTKEGVASTGWATMLEGMIRGGWVITATWPVRSERSGRMNSIGTNSLASSIVLSLRPREVTARATTRRGFLNDLKRELPKALAEMQQGGIAPVDLAQATIGPGMAIFSRYSGVHEPDGRKMTVRTALTLINDTLGQIMAEEDSELDADSRFCLRWFTQYGWGTGPYGDADTMSRAFNTSVDGLIAAGVVANPRGEVRLRRPADLDTRWNVYADDRITLWEVTLQIAHSLERNGLDGTAPLLAAASQRVEQDAIQMLAYRLYEVGQAKDGEVAGLFNVLGSAWAELVDKAGRVELGLPDAHGQQMAIDMEGD